MKENFEEMINKLDWQGFAEAFAKGDLVWHEKEWKDFIKLIRNKVLLQIEEIVEEKTEFTTDGGIATMNDPQFKLGVHTEKRRIREGLNKLKE